MGLTARERQVRARLKQDFLHYAPRCLRIRTKAGAVLPFRLNAAQLHLHRALEQQRAETGQVRALIVKGRQQGCSTYVQARFFWHVTHRRGVRAFILTHVEDATANLFGMAKRFYDHCPDLVRPRRAASNAKELLFDRLESGYRVGTAGGRGTARSDTIQYFHGSEVAFWPNAKMHVSGALQAVPDAPGTEVILESTSAGRQGLFFEMCEAARRGEGQYRLVFIPWFWQPEYRVDAPADFTPGDEEADYAALHGLDGAQLAWRRRKLVELGGAAAFRREYPANVEEAFMADIAGALWRRDQLDASRTGTAPALVRIVVGVDPSGGGGATNDEVGIVVAGRGHDGIAYVLDDRSGRFTPAGWGQRAVAAYRSWRADRIVAEKNFGGDMVAHVLRGVDNTASVKLVTASRGKAVRAEPVAALYERGLVKHVGPLIALEDEMVTWVPGGSAKSPNRVDALVWALSELMLQDATGMLDFMAAQPMDGKGNAHGA